MTWFRDLRPLPAATGLCLGALAWWTAPFLGLRTFGTRLAWTLALLLVWAAFLAARKLLRARRADHRDGLLPPKEGDADPPSRAEGHVDGSRLRLRIRAAIRTLETSNLGKTRGKAALYELPWYLVVGHPAAGKSSAILRSGLAFPLMGKEGAPLPEEEGAGSCDWFFSTEGVLLDTAGRYATQAEDRPEWLAFLKLLRKHRPKAPLNGILVLLSLPELLQHQTEAFARHARQVRQRISEVYAVFGTQVPVYLVFTKLDLLQGFGPFFEDLPEEARKQVWGATLAHEQADGWDLPKAVGQHVEALFQGLVQLGNDKLASARANQKRPALFAFPLEFHGLKEPLCRFAGHLVERDPYHAQPLVRGFYFTSAIQEPRTAITAERRICTQFDLVPPGQRPPEPCEARPFFLESLFRQVVFPDMYLAGRSARPRRSGLKLAGLTAGLVATALLAGCWTWSFIGNRKLILQAREELQVSRGLSLRKDLGDRMKALQVLQYRLEQLYQYRQQGRPWGLGWGLYQGRSLEKILRAEYFRGTRQLMLEPLKESLEARLREALAPAPIPAPGRTGRGAGPAIAAPGPRLEEVYNCLKTYLMLHTRERMDSAHLADQMPRHWRAWLEASRGSCAMQEISRMAERTVAFHISQAKEPDLPMIENRDDLVALARSRIRGEVALLSPLERIYSEIKARGNTRFAPVTVASVLGSRDLDLVGSSAFVPGCFTRDAWQAYFREAIQQASLGRFKGTDWVLDNPLELDPDRLGSPEGRREKLTTMYQADYIKAWERFMQGLVIHPFGSLDRAAGALERLGSPQDSPIKLLLARATAETSWDNPSELARSLDKAKQSVLETTTGFLNGGSRAVPPERVPLGPIGSRFAPLAGLMEGPHPPLEAYLDQLGRLRAKFAVIAASGEAGSGAQALLQATLSGSGSELTEALQTVDAVCLAPMAGPSREIVRPVLVRPLTESFTALVGPAQEHLDALWQQQVYGPWSSLAAKYPFADSSSEASPGEISRLLKPGEGTLARFVDKELGPLVALRGEGYAARTWGTQGVGLGPTFLEAISRMRRAGNALLGEGESCRFELQPVPTPGLTDILIEVDGQKLLYRMGPQAWTALSWPGPSAGQGARLQVTSFAGATIQVQHFPGRLGFLRLLDQARIENPRGPAGALEWHLRMAPPPQPRSSIPGPSGAPPCAEGVRFNYRVVSGADPLALVALRRHTLPRRVGQ